MTNATLALEQLMLDPAFADLVQALRRHAPVHERDQALQAFAEAGERLQSLATAISGKPLRTVAPSQIDRWLRLAILDTFLGYAGGTASTCRHNPDAGRPTPVYAALWRPGLIACAGCLHLFAAARGSVLDRTCDGCGHICAGPDAGDPITPGMVQLGPLVVQYGTCRGCISS